MVHELGLQIPDCIERKRTTTTCDIHPLRRDRPMVKVPADVECAGRRRLTERRAIDEYRCDGVEEALFETMRGLGWEYADIAVVARGAEFRTGYGMPWA
jgi:hypothetical protein